MSPKKDRLFLSGVQPMHQMHHMNHMRGKWGTFFTVQYVQCHTMSSMSHSLTPIYSHHPQCKVLEMRLKNAKVWPKKMSLTPIWWPRGLLWEMIRKWCGNGTGQDQTYRHILETWNYWNFSNTLTGYLPCHLVLKYLCNSLHIFASGIATQPGNQLLYHQFVACGAEPVQDRHDMVSGIIRNP